MALTTQLSIVRGDTCAWSVAVTFNGAVFSLVGCTLRFTVKRSPKDSDADAVITRTSVGNGISITDAANGLAQIVLTPTHTANLQPLENYVWDLQVTTVSGQVYTPDGLRGKISVIADVSRTTP